MMCRSVTSGIRPRTLFHLFHQWDKWARYELPTTTVISGQSYDTSARRQRRTCQHCGKTQDKLI